MKLLFKIVVLTLPCDFDEIKHSMEADDYFTKVMNDLASFSPEVRFEILCDLRSECEKEEENRASRRYESAF